MTPTKTSKLLDYTNKVAESIPNEAVLGQLVWFSINAADVPLEQARKDLEALGLSTDTLRKRLRPIDAFKKATNTMVKNNLHHSEGVESNFMVRQVGQDTETSHRHVILERVNTRTGKKRRLSYDKVAEIVFSRGFYNAQGDYEGDEIEVTQITPAGLDPSHEEKVWLKNLDQIGDHHEHWKTHLDSHAVRTYIREYVDDLAGILVRESGGVYFLSQKHAATVTALATWVKSIGNSDLHALPLIDLVEQREMLLKAFEDETLKEVGILTQELAGILQDPERTITQATYERYTEKASELIAKMAEYSDMLNARTGRTAIELDMFKRQTLKLGSRVKTPKRTKV